MNGLYRSLLPSADPVVRARLCEALDSIVNKAQEPNKSKKVQYTNAKHCVLFEAINLILHFQGWVSVCVRGGGWVRVVLAF